MNLEIDVETDLDNLEDRIHTLEVLSNTMAVVPGVDAVIAYTGVIGENAEKTGTFAQGRRYQRLLQQAYALLQYAE